MLRDQIQVFFVRNMDPICRQFPFSGDNVAVIRGLATDRMVCQRRRDSREGRRSGAVRENICRARGMICRTKNVCQNNVL
jgi:hypothetical protein